MGVQLNKDDEIINHVEENVNEGLDKVEKGTKENLKKRFNQQFIEED